MRRDRANILRLQRVVRSDDLQSQRTIDDISGTLERTRQELNRLVEARGHYREKAAKSLELFNACSRFIEFYDKVLASRKDPAQAIIEKYFDPDEYWRQTDDVTEQSIEKERELFAMTGLQVADPR